MWVPGTPAVTGADLENEAAGKFGRTSLRVVPSKRNSDVKQLRVPVVPAPFAEATRRGRNGPSANSPVIDVGAPRAGDESKLEQCAP